MYNNYFFKECFQNTFIYFRLLLSDERRNLWFSKLLVFYSLHLHLIADQLIHIGDHCGALDVHQDERWNRRFLERIVSAGCRSGIDVETILVFVRLELVRVTGDEDVHVQLALDERQRFGITPWHDLNWGEFS